jgi:hypothetical protein
VVNGKHCITYELVLCFHYPVKFINLQWHLVYFIIVQVWEDAVFHYYDVDYTDLSQWSRVLYELIVASGASKCVLFTKYCQDDQIKEVE